MGAAEATGGSGQGGGSWEYWNGSVLKMLGQQAGLIFGFERSVFTMISTMERADQVTMPRIMQCIDTQGWHWSSSSSSS